MPAGDELREEGVVIIDDVVLVRLGRHRKLNLREHLADRSCLNFDLNVGVDHLPDGIDAAFWQLPALSRLFPVNQDNRGGGLIGSTNPFLSRQDRGVIGRDGILTSGHGCTHAWRLWSHTVGADQTRRDSSIDHETPPVNRCLAQLLIGPCDSSLFRGQATVFRGHAVPPFGDVFRRPSTNRLGAKPLTITLGQIARLRPMQAVRLSNLRRSAPLLGRYRPSSVGLRIIWSLHRLWMDRRRPYPRQMT